MSNIDYLAADCNCNLPANARNNSKNNNSLPVENIPSKDDATSQDRVHGFSNKLARIKNQEGKSLGWNAALILRYLAVANRKHGVKIEGKRWVRVNLDHISEQYFYLGRSTVDDNILFLEEFGCLEKQNAVPGLKRRKNDRTRCYHIPKRWMDAAEEEPRYFQTGFAEVLGVPAAVIHYNFQYWLRECEEKGVERRVRFSPADMVERLPFSESTIKRSLKALQRRGYIQPVLGKTCWYAENNSEMRGSNPDTKGPNPDTKGPNPDEKGSNPDNYIDCSIVVDELEKDSKLKPAASVLVNSDDVSKADEDKIHLLHRVIVPFADEQDKEEMKHGKIISADDEIYSSPVSSTDHMGDEVEDVESRWPVVKSLKQLHRINKYIHPFYKDLLSSPDSRQKLLRTVLDICAKTMTLVPQNLSDELYEDQDGEKILETLLPYYHEFLEQTQLDPAGDLFNILYHGALETLVGAFLWPRERHDSYNHGIPEFTGTTYEIHLVLWRQAENLRLEAIDEEFQQRREDYASRDEDKENDADLSPAQKTRIFRNALNARNQVGWITFEQKHATHLIDIKNTGLQRIQKLFELNTDLTPAKLLPVMDGCINEFISRPAPPKRCIRGVKWHARRGYRLHFFASYLSTIDKQLGVDSPVKIYLSDDQPAEEEVALAA